MNNWKSPGFQIGEPTFVSPIAGAAASDGAGQNHQQGDDCQERTHGCLHVCKTHERRCETCESLDRYSS